MIRFATLTLLVCAFATPVAASAADGEAESHHHIDSVRVDVHGVLGGYGSLGAGIHVDIPLVPHGFIDGVDDELALSPGVDVFFNDFYPDYYSGGPYLVPGVVLQWNFYLGSYWSVFPEAGVAVYAGDRDFLRRGPSGRERFAYAAPNLAVGARYHFNARNALIGRIGTPTGIQVGITF